MIRNKKNMQIFRFFFRPVARRFSGRKNLLGTKNLQYLHLRYIRSVVFTQTLVKMRYYTIYLHLRYCK